MLASRAKSESFAYKGGETRTTGHKEDEKDVGKIRRSKGSIESET